MASFFCFLRRKILSQKNNYSLLLKHKRLCACLLQKIILLNLCVLTYMTKHKEQSNTSTFYRKSSSGVRREIHNSERRSQQRRSSEIQGTALSKCLRAWSCIYRSMHVGVAQSRHAFVGGTVGKMTDTHKQKAKNHQKCQSSTHRSWGTCRSDSRFPQLVV